MTHTGFTFQTKDDLTLMGRGWLSASDSVKGVINLVHGLGEHSGRYAHVAEAFTKAGYHFAAFDLRGHGLSAGKRGHTPDFSTLLDDIELFLEESKKKFGDSYPHFLYGHSLGGSLVINYILKRKADLAGVISTSPGLKTAFEPPKLKIMVGKVMSKIWPTMIMPNGLEKAALSRDDAVVKAYEDDVYVHDRLSAKLGVELLENGQYAFDHAQDFSFPMLLMHGTEDRITSPEASRKFAEKAGSQVELVLWEGYYHETHNDFGKEKVIEKMISWVDKMQKNKG